MRHKAANFAGSCCTPFALSLCRNDNGSDVPIAFFVGTARSVFCCSTCLPTHEQAVAAKAQAPEPVCLSTSTSALHKVKVNLL